MPWNPGDASKHKKGLSSKQARQWSHVANSMLQKTGNEGRAVRAANSSTRPYPSKKAVGRKLFKR